MSDHESYADRAHALLQARRGVANFSKALLLRARKALDDELRQRIAADGVPPERIEVEFERVMEP